LSSHTLAERLQAALDEPDMPTCPVARYLLTLAETDQDAADVVIEWLRQPKHVIGHRTIANTIEKAGLPPLGHRQVARHRNRECSCS